MKVQNRKPIYLYLDQFLDMLDDDVCSGCTKLYHENKKLIKNAKGSRVKHQSWEGGYIHHLEEIMNYALGFYNFIVSTRRHIEYSFSDVILVVYLHDLEKPWKYGSAKDQKMLKPYKNYQDFIFAKAREYNIPLTEAQKNAILYVHGEGTDYDPERCIQGPLAVHVHMFDTLSARSYAQYPLKKNDPWCSQ